MTYSPARSAKDNDALEELVKKFRRKLPARFQKLESLLEDTGNLDEVHRALHKLAGTSGSFGLSTVSKAADGLDTAIRANAHAGVVRAKLEQLREAIEAEAVTSQVRQKRATERSIGILGGDVLVGEIESLLADQIYEASAIASGGGTRHIAALHDAILVDAADGDSKAAEIEVIRRAYAGANVPILMIVGNASLENSVAATHAGADLVLQLPLSKAGLVDALSSVLAKRDAERPTILVVDDDPEAVELICQQLVSSGLEARGIASPHALLDALREQTPSAVVLDFDMPGFSGVELCATLRASRQYRFLPIVFLTNRHDRRARKQAYQVGCDDFLHKSDAAELPERLRARIRRLQGLQSAAEVDALTGLALRRSFVPKLEAYISAAIRRQMPLGLAMLDLDHFKSVNDTEGHVVGDLVLAQLGACIESRLRSTDLACRWGGEEFVIAFPQCEVRGVRKTLEDIREALEEIAFPGKDGPFTVHFSAGISELDSETQQFDTLIATADKRLYLAKNNGRNCIVGPEECEGK